MKDEKKAIIFLKRAANKGDYEAMYRLGLELEQQVDMRKKTFEHLDTKINDKRAALKKHETERNHPKS